MLTQEIKKKIDTARDILVGKVPDPKAQVEQITTALIYKFMDDMDKQSAALPKGKIQFFSNGFGKYAWSKLMDTKLGGQERLNLYVEAITRMSENPHLPPLFREIFKDAFLPYRNPETLSLFLKEINSFNYDHSENLGDAFEYLLSVLGAQGDAGQFRTPRHIIDFIVEVIDPKKDESILDPACGTAGFLISAYKHILKANKSGLKPDEKKKLNQNLTGYDISPDMVKLSLVNMYLHGFRNPNIYEYDTLTSEEKWNERFDVMMANPPFMTPKGGIRPHKRFIVQANRSEVLFVDYIMEHLNSKGRAGIIVPEGVIFQSTGSHKLLRKLLVEDGLYAVASLPAGVFNPYATVKTCILFFDNQLSKKSKEVLFIKVRNDGFDLGAQRKPIEENDLPRAVEILKAHRNAIITGKKNPYLKKQELFAWSVSKNKIEANDEHNLSGEIYIASRDLKMTHDWPLVEIGEVCDLMTGGTPKSNVKEYYKDGAIKWLVSGDINKREIFDCEGRITEMGMKSSNTKLLPINSVLIALNGQGKTRGMVAMLRTIATCNQSLVSINPKDKSVLLPEYLFYMLKGKYREIRNLTGDEQRSGLNMPIIKKIKFPLPPIAMQEQFINELEGYQKVIDGARQIIAHHKTSIKIDDAWDKLPIKEVCEINPSKAEIKPLDENTMVSFVPMADITVHQVFFESKETKKIKDVIKAYTYFRDNDVLLAKITPCFENGKSGIARGLVNGIGFGSTEFFVLRPKNILPELLYHFISEDKFVNQGKNNMTGSAGQQRLTSAFLSNYIISLPPLEIQKKIIAEMQNELKHIESAKQMVEIYEEKINTKVAEIWSK